MSFDEGVFAFAVMTAVKVASQSPCQKSKRGAVLFYAEWPVSRVVASAYNSLPVGECTGSDACRSMCGTRCEHAEQAAIRALPSAARWDIGRIHLMHAKVIDGELVTSGPPSCAECSKMILAWGVGSVWLYHADGWRRYTGEEFHRLTLEHRGLVEP